MSIEIGATGRVGMLRWRDLRLAEGVRYGWIIGRVRRRQEGEELKSLTNLDMYDVQVQHYPPEHSARNGMFMVYS